MEMIEKLWASACCGNIDELKDYFESGIVIDTRYRKFGDEHSLIMGAFRNNQWETVDYLISVGASVTDKEKKEIQKQLNRIKYMEIISQNC